MTKKIQYFNNNREGMSPDIPIYTVKDAIEA